MNLKHIKETKCPHCGARVTVEKQRDKHCNGHWNESRIFACGCELAYTPNYKSTREVSECTQCDMYKSREKIRKKAIERLCGYISKMRVDSDFKETLLKKIRYLYI